MGSPYVPLSVLLRTLVTHATQLGLADHPSQGHDVGPLELAELVAQPPTAVRDGVIGYPRLG